MGGEGGRGSWMCGREGCIRERWPGSRAFGELRENIPLLSEGIEANPGLLNRNEKVDFQ